MMRDKTGRNMDYLIIRNEIFFIFPCSEKVNIGMETIFLFS